MQITENYPLKQLNTFGIKARAAFFTELHDENDISEFLHRTKFRDLPLLMLGGGSNLLFTRDFEGLVVHINHKGIRVIREDVNYVFVEAAAGEKWEDLIAYCIANNYGGLENLSGIPGNVGSSPIQNIGAYGVEVKDCISEVHVFNPVDGYKSVINAEECRFGYRDSIFKRELKGKVMIDKVVFCLSKKPDFNLCYKGVEEEVGRISPNNTDIKAVSQAIQNIRKSKIPDTEEVGSAGSFFKNPFVDKTELERLSSQFPQIPFYKNDDGTFKLAAAWLIEQCGWKGYRKGDAGVNGSQPLILVNYGNATGQEIFALSVEIRKSVNDRFGVELETEVNII